MDIKERKKERKEEIERKEGRKNRKRKGKERKKGRKQRKEKEYRRKKERKKGMIINHIKRAYVIINELL